MSKVRDGHFVRLSKEECAEILNLPMNDQMKENIPTPETVKTPPPLTPKDSLSVEVELEAIRNRAEPISAHGYYNDRYLDTKRLIAIVEELRKENAEHKRLEKELNYILHPKEDFPKEPSFCDLVAYVKSDLATAQAQLRRKDEALEKLSKLGNGDLCGNSVGNQIARAALADGKEGGE